MAEGTDQTVEAAAKAALHAVKHHGCTIQGGCTPDCERRLEAVMTTVVPLIRASVVAECAQALQDHADKFSPVDGNYAQKRMHRHMLIAARVVANLDPPSKAEIAAALVRALGSPLEGDKT